MIFYIQTFLSMTLFKDEQQQTS